MPRFLRQGLRCTYQRWSPRPNPWAKWEVLCRANDGEADPMFSPEEEDLYEEFVLGLENKGEADPTFSPEGEGFCEEYVSRWEDGESSHRYLAQDMEGVYEEYVSGWEDDEFSHRSLAQDMEAAALGLIVEAKTDKSEEEADEDIFDKVFLPFQLFQQTRGERASHQAMPLSVLLLAKAATPNSLQKHTSSLPASLSKRKSSVSSLQHSSPIGLL